MTVNGSVAVVGRTLVLTRVDDVEGAEATRRETNWWCAGAGQRASSRCWSCGGPTASRAVPAISRPGGGGRFAPSVRPSGRIPAEATADTAAIPDGLRHDPRRRRLAVVLGGRRGTRTYPSDKVPAAALQGRGAVAAQGSNADRHAGSGDDPAGNGTDRQERPAAPRSRGRYRGGAYGQASRRRRNGPWSGRSRPTNCRRAGRCASFRSMPRWATGSTCNRMFDGAADLRWGGC